jgi:DNA-binding transcriptional LysR family regulator
MSLTNGELIENLTLRELQAFCLICECRNLSQVALSLGVSQSSVSQMVQRWRDVVGDPLFVRARYGVTPTEVAVALRLKMRPLLHELKLALSQPLGFTPAKSERVFKVHMSDIGQLVFLAELNSHLNQFAPNISLSIRNCSWDEVESSLASGEIDAAIGSLPMIKGRVHARTLRKEPYVTVMRHNHHLATKELDLATFSSAEHLIIDSTSSGHALVDEVLRAKGIKMRAGLTIPHYLAAETILAKSNYLLTVPQVAVSAFHKPSAYHIVPAPISLPTFDIRMHWHERSHRDQGVQWLQEAVFKLFHKP